MGGTSSACKDQPERLRIVVVQTRNQIKMMEGVGKRVRGADAHQAIETEIRVRVVVERTAVSPSESSS